MHLPYLRNLNISAVWLNSIYPSMDVHLRYDVVNYYNISSTYGTMDDFDRLLLDVHKSGR